MPAVRTLVRPDSSVASYGVVNSPCTQAMSRGSGDESFLRTSLASFFFARMLDVVYIDVAGNASPTLDRFKGGAL